MSLRQDVLRSLTLTELAIERKQAISTRHSDEDSDEELIYVVSLCGNPRLMCSSLFAQDIYSRDARSVPCTIAAHFQTGLTHPASKSAECSGLYSGIKVSLIRSFEGLSDSNIATPIPVALDI